MHVFFAKMIRSWHDAPLMIIKDFAMFSISRRFVFVGLFMLAAGATEACVTASRDIAVSHAYVRETITGQNMSAAYFDVKNLGSNPHTVVKIESPVASIVQLHETIEENGMMKMREISQLPLTSHAESHLQPGGMHVMLMGLHHALKAGDQVPFVLSFDDGSTQRIEIPVKTIS